MKSRLLTSEADDQRVESIQEEQRPLKPIFGIAWVTEGGGRYSEAKWGIRVVKRWGVTPNQGALLGDRV